MFANLIIVPEAHLDVDEAYGWYEERRFGLGEEFLCCVDSCVQTICKTPNLYPIIHEQYRRALVRRFPYSVFYEYTVSCVTVYSIFHTSQEPMKWQSRFM